MNRRDLLKTILGIGAAVAAAPKALAGVFRPSLRTPKPVPNEPVAVWSANIPGPEARP